MLDDKEKKRLFNNFKKTQTEVTRAKSKLNQINDEKEAWFEKKKQASKKAVDLIKNIRAAKKDRDSLTKQVKELKEERDKLSEEIKIRIKQAKELDSEKKELLKKLGIKGDPSILKKEIDDLELKIETEVMSFDKEQKLMKFIKDKKKKYKEMQGISGIIERASNVSREITQLKQKAEEVHKKIQEIAKQSQVKHEEMIACSKDVDVLKKGEEGTINKCKELKEQFNNANEELKTELESLNVISTKVYGLKIETRREKKEKQINILKIKEKEVGEKIKEGKKLKTEDLLIYQANLEENEPKPQKRTV